MNARKKQRAEQRAAAAQQQTTDGARQPAGAKPPARPRSRRLRGIVGFVISAYFCSLFVPQGLCSVRADGFYDGKAETEFALADVVAKRVQQGVTPGMLNTGSEHFNGEWALVTNQMAVLGLGQVILAHPSAQERYLPAIRAAVASMLEPGSREFGTKEWKEDGFAPEVLDGPHGHVYLGYLDMALSMQRLVDPEMSTADAELNDRLTAALERRIDQSPYGLIETFPGVTFPADVATAIGAIALHARALKQPRPPIIAKWVREMERFRDSNGLLPQTANPDTGKATSPARGSGNALCVYLIAYADEGLANSLTDALFAHARASFYGFEGFLEYPSGNAGRADMDSGPVIMGVGVSATGFGLAAYRLFSSREQFTKLYRTAYLFGAPGSHGGGWSYLVGEGLGDAILLAMMTAGPEVVTFRKGWNG
ncbi:MAG: hypothetical protein ACJ790_15895 [Myxococcaceae bacterium]